MAFFGHDKEYSDHIEGVIEIRDEKNRDDAIKSQKWRWRKKVRTYTRLAAANGGHKVPIKCQASRLGLFSVLFREGRQS